MKFASDSLIGGAGIENVISHILLVLSTGIISIEHNRIGLTGRCFTTSIDITIIRAIASLVTRGIHNNVVGMTAGILCIGRSQISGTVMRTNVCA